MKTLVGIFALILGAAGWRALHSPATPGREGVESPRAEALAPAPGDPFAGADAAPRKEAVAMPMVETSPAPPASAGKRASGEAALRSALRSLSSDRRPEALREVAVAMSRMPAAAALELLQELEDPKEREYLLGAAIEAVAEFDLRTAAEWAAQVKEPVLRASAHNLVGMRWAERDPAGASGWATGLGDAARPHAMEGVMWGWFQQNPQDAFAWAAGMPDPGDRDPLFIKMAKLIAVRNPAQAAAWSLDFPSGAAQDQALHFSVFQWAESDLEGAVRWAGSLSPGPLRTEGELAIARSWSNLEPQGATSWAGAIADESNRTAALKITLAKWAEREPAAAAAWLGVHAQAPLSGEIFRSVTASLSVGAPELARRWVAATADPVWQAAGRKIISQGGASAPGG